MAITAARLLVEIGADDGAARAALSSFQGFLGNAASTMAGMLTADLFRGAVDGLKSLAAQGLEAYSSYERLGMSLESLTARELINASGTEKLVATGTAYSQLTDAQRKKLEDLNGQLVILEGSHKAQESALNNAITKGKESAQEIDARRQKIVDLREKMDGLRGQIGELSSQDGKLVTVMARVTEGQLSMTEAQALAGPKVKELLNWMQQLAIQSPFKQEDVALAFRTQMAYGFTADEAKRLTGAMIDFAAGSGASGSAMNQIGLALGQIKAKGKLAGQEVLQLVNAGLSVDRILAKAFGKSTAEIVAMREGGLIPADDAIKAITESMEKDFGGAAKRQTETFSGLLSSLDDIKSIGLREFFTSTFQAIQPYVVGFVNLFSSEAFMARLRQVGAIIGGVIGGGLERIKGLVAAFQSGGAGGLMAALGVSPEASAVITRLAGEIGGLAETVMGGLRAAFEWIQTTGLPLLNQGLAFVNLHWEEFRAGIVAVAAALAGATILATIAGVIAAIANPITLIIGAIGLLAAAWEGNWGGMRDTLTELWTNTLQPALAQLWAWLQTNIPLAIQTLAAFWTNTLKPALLAMWDYITNSLIPTLQAWWAFIQQNILPILSDLVQIGILVVTAALQGLVGIWNDLVYPALRAMWSFFNDKLIPIFTEVARVVRVVLGAAFTWAKQNVLDPFLDALTFIKGYIDEIIDLINRMKGALSGTTLPGTGTEGRASGGPVAAGQTYWVGERGPELFTPGVNGMITPNSTRTTNNSPTYVLNVYTSAPAEDVVGDFAMLKAWAA